MHSHKDIFFGVKLTSTSAEDTTIPPRGKNLVKTDIAIAIPPGHYGRIGK